MIDKLHALREDLTKRFPEREHIIDGCLSAVLSQEHVLLIGAPGTAKSALARSIAKAFGGTYFERLLTKFSTPDELFGPISLKSLENDRFERVIANKLPTVEFAFADECFKSSSAILNSLLTLMNERLYHNDGPPLQCPLVTLFGASNELPESGELDALYDRFLMRYDVHYLTQAASLRSVFLAEDPSPKQFLTMDELRQAQAETAKITISNDTVDGLIAIRQVCTTEKIIVSDRRWKRTLKIAKASAYMKDETVTSPEDLYDIAHALWREPSELPKVTRIVQANADPIMKQIREISNAALETSRTFNRAIAERHPNALPMALKNFGAQRAQLDKLGAAVGPRAQHAVASALAVLDGMMAQAKRSSNPINMIPIRT